MPIQSHFPLSHSNQYTADQHVGTVRESFVTRPGA